MAEPSSASRRLVSALGFALVVGLVLLAGADALGREGARVLSWSASPVGLRWFIAWLAAAWAAGALGLAGRARAGRGDAWPRRALPSAVVATAALFGLGAWRDGERAAFEGLAAVVARPSQPTAPPVAMALAPSDLATTRALTLRLGRRGDVDLSARGYLAVPAAGTQRFTLACAGACALGIDGRVIAQAAGGDARAEIEIALGAGTHALRLDLAQPAARARFALGWRRPAWIELLPLDAAVSTQPRDPAAFRRGERVAVLRVVLATLVTALLWLALLRLAPWAVAAAGTRLARAARTWWAERLYRQAALVFAAATVCLAVLRLLGAPHALAGGTFQAWTSEYMMQTVSVADLRAEPLRSLVYLHIQPPLFDALRAALVALHPTLEGEALLRAVDRGLYVCWGFAYGAAAALVFAWTARRFGPRAGLAGAALFALHPASIFYATFLDTTFVSAAGVLWLIYELWRCGEGRGRAARLAAVLVALLLTRSIVQWPFLFVAAASLWLIGADRRRAARALAAFALVTALFVAKQYALFGLTITSSFGPDSFCKGLSSYCQGTTPVPLPSLPAPGAAGVLRRTEKLGGEYNYNQLAFLKRSFAQMAEYRALLRATPPRRLAELMAHNVALWLRPSSRHSAHTLVDALPWRGAFDFAFSGGALVALLVAAALGWAWRTKRTPGAWRRGLGLALPCAYFAAVSIAFESGENMRYKFFVEPVLLVFLWGEACAAVARRPARAEAGA
jgi:hypothetical protein